MGEVLSTGSCLRHLWVRLAVHMLVGVYTRVRRIPIDQHRESTCRGSGVQWAQTGVQMEVGRVREELFSSGDILCPTMPLSLIPSEVL